MEIKWTPKAKNDYSLILDYLFQNWGLKEVEKFIAQTNRVINTIAGNPQIFVES